MAGPLPAVPKVVRVDWHFAQNADQNIQIRQFFQYTGTLSLGDAVTWLGQMAVAMQVFVGAILNNTLTMTGSELTDLSSATAPQVVNTLSQVGGDGNPELSAATAFVIRHHIARRYRGGHPRTYLPGMTQTFLSSSTSWSSSAMTTIMTAWATFQAACVALTGLSSVGTAQLVNVSYFEGYTNHTYPSGRVKAIPTPRATPLVDVVIASIANPTPGTQRRRNEQP